MTHTDCPYGFRVVGPVTETRRLVTMAAAFTAHCAADPSSEPEREAYLSAFTYGSDFKKHLTTLHTPKGFTGPCSSPFLWVDVDRAELAVALADTRRLVSFVLQRYGDFRDDDVVTFFSGRKGFHIGVPLVHCPAPSVDFHLVCRRLAEGLANKTGVEIDTKVYSKVNLLRAPNSTHPKTGLHKRRLCYEELLNLTAERIVELSREPLEFDLTIASTCPRLAEDWAESCIRAQDVHRTSQGRDSEYALQRATMDFIREGAEGGERNQRLFRAACDLREHGAPPALVHSLLRVAATDSGLPPAEVARTINSGIEKGNKKSKGGAA